MSIKSTDSYSRKKEVAPPVVQGPQPTEEELEEFKDTVDAWVHMDEQIKKLNMAVRERKMAMGVLTPKIQEFMIKYKYDDLQTKSGSIHSTVKKVAVPIKLKDVKQKLLAYGDQGEGEELMKEIFEAEREKVEKRALRRIPPKVSLNFLQI